VAFIDDDKDLQISRATSKMGGIHKVRELLKIVKHNLLRPYVATVVFKDVFVTLLKSQGDIRNNKATLRKMLKSIKEGKNSLPSSNLPSDQSNHPIVGISLIIVLMTKITKSNSKNNTREAKESPTGMNISAKSTK